MRLIEAERRVIEKLQLQLQQTRESARTSSEQQAKLAYDALAGGEASAQAALTEVEDTISKSQSRARSAEIALKGAQDKLESLQGERRAIYVDERRDAYAAQAVQLIHDDAAALESVLTQMSAVRDAFRKRLQTMEQIAMEANLDVVRTHGRVRQNLSHAVAQRAEFQSTWMSLENRQIFSGPVSTLLQTTLRSLVPELLEDAPDARARGEEEERRAV